MIELLVCFSNRQCLRKSDCFHKHTVALLRTPQTVCIAASTHSCSHTTGHHSSLDCGCTSSLHSRCQWRSCVTIPTPHTARIACSNGSSSGRHCRTSGCCGCCNKIHLTSSATATGSSAEFQHCAKCTWRPAAAACTPAAKHFCCQPDTCCAACCSRAWQGLAFTLAGCSDCAVC